MSARSRVSAQNYETHHTQNYYLQLAETLRKSEQAKDAFYLNGCVPAYEAPLNHESKIEDFFVLPLFKVSAGLTRLTRTSVRKITSLLLRKPRVCAVQTKSIVRICYHKYHISTVALDSNKNINVACFHTSLTL
jgi:hypothetical protein